MYVGTPNSGRGSVNRSSIIWSQNRARLGHTPCKLSAVDVAGLGRDAAARGAGRTGCGGAGGLRHIIVTASSSATSAMQPGPEQATHAGASSAKRSASSVDEVRSCEKIYVAVVSETFGRAPHNPIHLSVSPLRSCQHPHVEYRRDAGW